jgi:RNA polymerase sigma-70 factor (ECF subfamily)
VRLDIDDQVLVQAAQDGDLDAFELLVRRHQPAVYRVALRLLGSEADAHDATQETFVRAWRALPRFLGRSAVSTWLYRIVTRCSFDLIASREVSARLADAAPAPAASSDPAQAAEYRERLGAVTDAIARLPADQRAAFVLREFEGLSYDEIAQVLETSVAAVKGRIHRARLAVLKETTAWQ